MKVVDKDFDYDYTIGRIVNRNAIDSQSGGWLWRDDKGRIRVGPYNADEGKTGDGLKDRVENFGVHSGTVLFCDSSKTDLIWHGDGVVELNSRIGPQHFTTTPLTSTTSQLFSTTTVGAPPASTTTQAIPSSTTTAAITCNNCDPPLQSTYAVSFPSGLAGDFALYAGNCYTVTWNGGCTWDANDVENSGDRIQLIWDSVNTKWDLQLYVQGNCEIHWYYNFSITTSTTTFGQNPYACDPTGAYDSPYCDDSGCTDTASCNNSTLGSANVYTACPTTTTQVGAPSSCPYADTSEGPVALRIIDYQDGDIPAQNCSYTPIPQTIWDGTFPVREDVCHWIKDAISNTIDSEVPLYGAGISLDTTNCRWKLSISIGGAGTVCWVGYKTTGSDPTGTYSFDSGCAGGPSSLAVESYTPTTTST